MAKCNWLVLLAALAAGGCGCGSGAESQDNAHAAPEVEYEAWAVVSKRPTGPPAYLGNRGFGVRLNAFGIGLDEDGKSLPAFLMDGDSLVQIANLGAIELQANGSQIGRGETKDYRSRLDFRTGLLTVTFKQRLPDDRWIPVSVEAVADQRTNSLAQRVRIENTDGLVLVIANGNRDTTVRITSKADTWQSFETAMFPTRVSKGEHDSLGAPTQGTLAFRQSTEGLRPQDWKRDAGYYRFAGVLKGVPAVFERVVSIVPAPGADAPVPPRSFDATLSSAAEIWKARWQTDVEIEGPLVDQCAIRSFVFYLHLASSAKMPPMALSSAKYNGHRFWDAEAWILPALAFVAPDSARSATEWRLSTLEPDLTIPWEAGASGNDLTPEGFRRALHVNVWVSWWLERAMALALCDADRANAAQRWIAEEFLRLSTSSGDSPLEWTQVMSPDEGRLRDNDLVTNLGALACAEYAPEAAAGREIMRRGVAVPKASDGLPSTYERDAMNGYQQAAALLAIYPLERPFGEAAERALLDRYAGKLSSAGPAMGDAFHGVIAARLGRTEEAYDFWKAAWEPFVRPELMLFSERRKRFDVYFATGAGGSLQTVLFGFLGLRIERTEGETPGVSKPLSNGYRLVVRPRVPDAWKSVTFRNAHILGEKVTIRATRSGAQLIPGGE